MSVRAVLRRETAFHVNTVLSVMYRLLLPLFLLLCGGTLLAQPIANVDSALAGARHITRSTDPAVTKLWTSKFGYTLTLPEKAKPNPLGSTYSEAGMTETANFILPGGAGMIKAQYVSETFMVPQGFQLLDSTHVVDVDSNGTNGIIHRRDYIMRDQVVRLEIMVTPRGTAEYTDAVIAAIKDSFVPPQNISHTLPKWRYGRNAAEFQDGRSADERSKR